LLNRDIFKKGTGFFLLLKMKEKELIELAKDLVGSPIGLVVKKYLAYRLDFDLESISCDSHLVMGLGVDSLDIREIPMDIEDLFSLPEISDEDLAGIQTVQDVIGYVTERYDSEVYQGL